MRDVAVTGASGFVGRRLIERLRARPVSRDARPEEFAGCDVLCHLAAYIPEDMNDPSAADECMRVNVLHAQRVVNAALDAGVTHVVHVSTGNLYLIDDDVTTPRREDAPLSPARYAAAYLASKLAGETVVRDDVLRRGATVCVLRPSGIYGPGMRRGMLRTFIDRARQGATLEVRDGGVYGVDMVYVDDVADAIAEAVRRRLSGVFNIGSGVRTTSAEAAHAVVRVFGAGDVVVTGEPGFAGFPPLDITAARAALGFAPRTLDDGLRAWREALDGE